MRVVDIPSTQHTCNGQKLVLPARPLDRNSSVYVVAPNTEFKTQEGYPWASPFYHGLKVLLAKFPPPIELPQSVSVYRTDKLPGMDNNIEGKLWTLTWSEKAHIVLHGVEYGARCSFTVYHKYDKNRSEANWRVYVVVKPDSSSLPPRGFSEYEALGTVVLKLARPASCRAPGSEIKEALVTTGHNPRKNNLVRPSNGLGDLASCKDTYVVLDAHEFEWVSAHAESHARAKKQSSNAAAILLDREHFLTQPTGFRFTVASSLDWFYDEMQDSALIGIPKATLFFPQGDTVAPLLKQIAKKLRVNEAKVQGGEQRVALSLSAFAHSPVDLDGTTTQ